MLEWRIPAPFQLLDETAARADDVVMMAVRELEAHRGVLEAHFVDDTRLHERLEIAVDRDQIGIGFRVQFFRGLRTSCLAERVQKREALGRRAQSRTS